MILILPSIKSTELMNSLRYSLTIRTGLTKNFFHTGTSATGNWSNLSVVVPTVISRNPVPVPDVRLHPFISTRIMEPKVSSYAKSAMPDSLRMKAIVSLP